MRRRVIVASLSSTAFALCAVAASADTTAVGPLPAGGTLQPPGVLQQQVASLFPTGIPAATRFGPLQTISAGSATNAPASNGPASPPGVVGQCVGIAVPPQLTTEGGYPEVAFKGYISCSGSAGTTTIKVCPQINVPSGYTDYGNCGTKSGTNGVTLTVYRERAANRDCRTYIYTTIPAGNPPDSEAYSGVEPCN